ncbi:MAG TPA: D-alanyl-D-alanine carboxypeptidase/D-alanyl-D-alanine-endopeptidase [Polyangia bacterium]|nr:D-alanyl-D-alanine carboxypeptidase/D-alanyl-D-alanine-endopeptidase [Polyangia bacterium]
MSAPRSARAVAVALAISFSNARASAPAKPAAKTSEAHADKAAAAEIAPAPPQGDADAERITRMQAALRAILADGALRKSRVGIRVMEARTGRLFFEKRGGVLMDPASNQKVLATTTALMRLGADWRFRTELTGPAPDADGIVAGDLVLRGSGDPTVTSADLASMATSLAARGVTRVDGAVIADPRRIGSDEAASDRDDAEETSPDGADTGEAPQRVSPRAPLVVNHGLMTIRVRPGAAAGWPVDIVTHPAGESFAIRNLARTRAGGRSRVSVRLSLVGARIEVEVAGKIALGHRALVYRRRVPQQALFSAVLLRAALEDAGVAVRDPSRVGAAPAPRTGKPPPTLLARHESAPLSVLLRRINKDSDNEHAERVLDAAGAEVYGGAPTSEKGLRLLREVIGELGLPPGSYVPHNGSGLGHVNRITADAMADLLRALYLDPRVGPELMQSLSVGGVDGTTRNRFKGTIAARRVRAKTGTLAGKSCLSGLVGDGPDVLAFSILVQGLPRRHGLAAVRGAQVLCVNAMMRYVREARGAAGEAGSAPPDLDVEAGEDVSESEGEATEPEAPSTDDPVDAVLEGERREHASQEAAAAAAEGATPAPPTTTPAPQKPPVPAPATKPSPPPAPSKPAPPKPVR